MTSLRRNIWNLGTPAAPWHPVTLSYAHAVRAMQQLPVGDPRSWRYQAAMHGTYDAPPRGALWNQCQHATWYFLPWHRMYLHRFESILRALLPVGERAGFALPYWDYSSGGPSAALPPAFRAPTLPDGSANPLYVAQRAASVNAGAPLSAAVTNTSVALAQAQFTISQVGAVPGFGGPRTGFAHQGPAFGSLENRPHGTVHVAVGGGSGLMTDPNTAALDPIFWLHHCNIDRLWEVWRLQQHQNTTQLSWRNKSFTLVDATGAKTAMKTTDVLDTVAQLDYTYEDLPLVAGEPERRRRVPAPQTPPVLIGSNDTPLTVGAAGGSTTMSVTPLDDGLAAGDDPTRVYLNLTDIDGTSNPGIVYDVLVNVPPDADDDVRAEHSAGLVSFFGIENTTPRRKRDAHGMRYSFDITGIVNRLRSAGTWSPDAVRVTLVPITPAEDAGLAADASPVTVATVALYQG